ncbi:MAG TPA: hypothetical protein DEB39_09915, partial [Planctomycetaceae bacterium]|nr:hypothetical protein [Planctomycetaceae bacterium]
MIISIQDILAKPATILTGDALETLRTLPDRDILDGIRFLATLDSKTSLICGSLDGTIWSMEELYAVKRPPLHPHCRSILLPYIKLEGVEDEFGNRPAEREDFETMARERHDAKISATGKGKPWNRLSYDYRKQLYYKEVATYEKQHGKGSAFRPVSGNTSYAEYLAKQPEDFRREVLGPIRAKLFDGGKLQLKDMVSLDTGYERSVSFLEDLVEGRTTVAGKSQEAPGTLPDIRSAEKFTEVFGGVNEKFQKRIDDITAERNESLKSYDDQLASATTKARHDAILKRRTEELNRFQSEIGEVKKERAHEAISMLFPINDAYSENRGNLRSAALKDGRKDVIDAADM